MPRYDSVSLNGCGMVNREISGSGRINASVFVDGKSMMKDCSVKHGEEVGAGNQMDFFW